jgi:hypothetical protein
MHSVQRLPFPGFQVFASMMLEEAKAVRLDGIRERAGMKRLGTAASSACVAQAAISRNHVLPLFGKE